MAGSWQQWVTLLVVLLAFAVVLTGTIIQSDADSHQRICVESTAGKEMVSNGGRLWGLLTLDSSDNVISYELYYNASLSAILSVHIKGPEVWSTGAPTVDPLSVTLCGLPSLTHVCDTTIPYVLRGTVRDVRIPLLDILKNRHLYYLDVTTALFPTGGALRSRLHNSCGLP